MSPYYGLFFIFVNKNEHLVVMISLRNVVSGFFLTLAILFYGETFGFCAEGGPSQNQIWYTSSDGNVVRPRPKAFTQKVVSNIYKNGKGVITFDGDLTKIGPSAFNGNTNLRSIHIPEGVNSIEVYAFFECSELVDVILPESVSKIAQKAFSGCGKLTMINFPENLVEIKVAAFENCASLKKVCFHKSLKGLEYGAFSGCSSIEEAIFEGGLKELEESVFWGCKRLHTIILPATIKRINQYCFFNCESLEEIDIPETLNSLGKGAFAGCRKLRRFKGFGVSSDGRSIVVKDGNLQAVALAGLKEFTVPSEVKTIGGSVFSHSDIRRIVIPEGVTHIGSYAFASCENLESIFLPGTVESSGVDLFENCPKLTRIEGPLASDDGRCLIIKDVLVSAAINGITQYCIQEGVRKIGEEAFYNNTHLEKVSFPSTLTSIRKKAFENCSSLTIIDLPRTLSYIQYDAFVGCKSLKSITVRAFNPPELNNRQMFDDVEIIYVPSETFEEYKNDKVWGWFFEKMKAIQ